MYESPFGETETYEFPAETGEWEVGQEFEFETLEAELAAELLQITTEAELDQFLGKLARSVVKGASSFIKSPIGRTLGGVLKNVAKTALPAVGGALGSMVLPGVGTAIGAKLGSMAGGLLEAGEAEMMGEAEAEFEAAQRYVRFARTAWSNAARAPQGVPPRSVARAASISAARMHAPALLQDGRRTSQWRRRRGSNAYRYGWPGYPPAAWYGEPQFVDNGFDEPEPWTGAGADYTEFPAEFERSGPGPAPGAAAAAQSGTRGDQGTWVRRRGRIVVLGV